MPDPDAPDGVRTEVLDPLADDFDRRVHRAARARCSPIRGWRWWCTPGARTWPSCGAPGETEIRNVFDTQVAAGFLGLGSQEGYESLVRKVLGARLKGSEGFTALGPPPAHRPAARVRR